MAPLLVVISSFVGAVVCVAVVCVFLVTAFVPSVVICVAVVCIVQGVVGVFVFILLRVIVLLPLLADPAPPPE